MSWLKILSEQGQSFAEGNSRNEKDLLKKAQEQFLGRADHFSLGPSENKDKTYLAAKSIEKTPNRFLSSYWRSTSEMTDGLLRKPQNTSK